MVSTSILYRGTEAPLAVQIPLRAGPLTAQFEDGDLRTIRLGEREVIRRWYAAVRDYNWLTIPPQLSNLRIDAGTDHFTVSYDVANREREIDFTWHGTITGDAKGTITFTLDGVAHSTFRKNRIGFCLLHPLDAAGARCRLDQTDGEVIATSFPRYISPHQPFMNLSGMAHEIEPGVWAELKFEGDVFETEDQRNWTDASFKTYCTPLGLPFPVTIQAGERVWQRVTLSLRGTVPPIAIDSDPAVTVSLTDERTPLPPIGLGANTVGHTLTPLEIERLKQLAPAHLRVELHLADADHEAVLRAATAEADALGVGLEIAVFVPDARPDSSGLAQILDSLRPTVAAWLIFRENGLATRPEDIDAVTAVLRRYAPSAPVGGGTNANFTELNRMRPPVDALDFVSFSAQPQEHTSDVRSLAETPQTMRDVIASAKQFAGGKPIAVSPVTLYRRLNPYATGPDAPTPPGELARTVDPRQLSLFGAAWTLAYLKYIVEAGGLHHVTAFETAGWRGVLETAEGSPLPDKFPSLPSSVFPLYHVLADLAAFAGGDVIRSVSSRPLQVDCLCLALRKNGRTRILLANLTEQAQIVRLSGVSGAALWTLDERSAVEAATAPETFRARSGTTITGDSVHLRPYASARIDITG